MDQQPTNQYSPQQIPRSPRYLKPSLNLPQADCKPIFLKQSELNSFQTKYSNLSPRPATTQKSYNSLKNTQHRRSPESHNFQRVKLPQTKICYQSCGQIQGFAANTHQGLIRNYNQDRVSIALNIQKPVNKRSDTWPQCAYFGLFDGHGGKKCANFLRDNLHTYIIREPSFPKNPRQAIIKGFQAADRDFLTQAVKMNEKSGSCAIVLLFVGSQLYVANTGDSRAVLSGERGRKVFLMSKDHKPNDPKESKRIISAGGDVFFSGVPMTPTRKVPMGCFRVNPGRLAISRSFGDIDAKLAEKGGNPRVVISTPEIRTLNLTQEHDFILVASDGIFDMCENEQVVNWVWEIAGRKHVSQNRVMVGGIEKIIKEAFRRMTTDNISVVFIPLVGLLQALAEKSFRYI